MLIEELLELSDDVLIEELELLDELEDDSSPGSSTNESGSLMFIVTASLPCAPGSLRASMDNRRTSPAAQVGEKASVSVLMLTVV